MTKVSKLIAHNGRAITTPGDHQVTLIKVVLRVVDNLAVVVVEAVAAAQGAAQLWSIRMLENKWT